MVFLFFCLQRIERLGTDFGQVIYLIHFIYHVIQFQQLQMKYT